MSTAAAFTDFADLYDVNGLASLGISRAGFKRALVAAQETMEPGTTSNEPSGQVNLEVLYESIAEKLERKSERAQAKADELEIHACTATDPARAEILMKRVEIKTDRAENLARNAEYYDTIPDFPAVGNERLENFYGTLPDVLLKNAAYHEERVKDLTELSKLVRENGHEAWADKILARAGISKDHSENLADSAERISETGPSNFSETVEEPSHENEAGGAAGNGDGIDSEADPADLIASDDNQAALEGRFIELYERLMEKQVSFKESVEPFKTDNQNAGKG